MSGVYDIAEQVRTWLDAGEDVRVAQVIESTGFSSREPGAAAAWTPGSPPVGRLPGVDPGQLRSTGLVEVSISADDAAAAGLSCGGSASVLVQPASAYPAETWTRLAAREPICLVTPVPDGPTTVFTPTTVREAFAFADDVPRLFGRGVTATAVVTAGEQRLAVAALWPVPTLVVVGDGLIADALRDAAALLGWTARVSADADAAVAAVGALHASDAVVVLSHDRAVDGPALAAALGGPAGYVGALGSRRTQQARREWLTEHGVASDVQERIHGPAGLDLDAHTPGEIAISIAAEILAERAGSSAGSLRDREGPVHGAGVQAPPPRY